MLIALFADLHANFAALEACLKHAREHGAQRFVFLGDLVGYGPDPGEVVDAVRALEGAIVVKGNHDEAVEVEPKVRDLNDLAYAALVWTRGVLSHEQRDYLATLPLLVREGDQCYVHASAARPEEWEYVGSRAAAERSVQAAGTPYVFAGHVHSPTLFYSTPAGKMAEFSPTPASAIPIPKRRNWLAIVGSLGQPRDGNPRASYALFDRQSERLTFYRVPYDHMKTAQRIVAAGLPEVLAERIIRGSV